MKKIKPAGYFKKVNKSRNINNNFVAFDFETRVINYSYKNDEKF